MSFSAGKLRTHFNRLQESLPANLVRWLIGLYLAQAAPGSAYGSMGALITAAIDERARRRREADTAPRPVAS